MHHYTDEEYYRLADALADFVATMTEEELREELAHEGIDFDVAAAETRAIVDRAIATFREEQRESAAAKRWRAGGWQGYSENECGNPVSVHRCTACGYIFTVCPPKGPNDEGWEGCMDVTCGSYDESRDADRFFDGPFDDDNPPPKIGRRSAAVN